MTIEFFFDCSSPWSYLGFERVQPLAAELGETIVWRPVLVGGIFNAVNPSVYFLRENVPQKQRHIAKDLRDWCRSTGLDIRFPPSIFPVNSAKAMRGCMVAEKSGALVPFARLAFEAYWRDDRDISDEAVLADLADKAGVGGEGFLAAISSPEMKDRLRANTDEAIARGAFGVPTMFLDGDDMYFGVDRLPLLREAILRKRGVPPANP